MPSRTGSSGLRSSIGQAPYSGAKPWSLSDTIGRGLLGREHVLTTEEAALRQVALLVARGAPTSEIFETAAEQVARMFGPPWVGVMRYDSAESFVVVATWGEHPFPVGSRWQLDGPSPYEAVLRTGQPVGLLEYAGLPGTVAEAARNAGIVGAIAAPIVVDDVTWGVITVPATRTAPIPEGAETRLSVFTELVATAISNADARASLALLADEQAALRRVATLVARESEPVEIFGAVTEEARRVLGSEAAGLLRFDPDETAVLVAQSETPWPPPPLGTRFTLDGENVVTQVFRTEQTVRVDDWSDSSGAVAAMATILGVRSAVASPVLVEGRLWGTLIAVTGQDEPLPALTESRLVQFTGLVATAIANAGARGALSRLADEQAALRRVAVLVAQQPSPVEVFAAVTEAVGPLLGADLAAMHVFRDDGVATVVASWSQAGATLPIGTELSLDGDSATARIFNTTAAARIDTYVDVEGETADVARELRLRSTVGAPILVQGRLWGALMAATRSEDPLPDDAEARIAAFTELVATAVSNAQAQEELQRLADEQAALRRVATLVAHGVGPEGVFRAVAVEVGVIFGADVAAIVRFEDDGTVTVLGDVGGPHVSGKRVALDEGYVVHQVRETSRSARFDTDDPSAADMPSLVRALGIRSSVASPIVVEDKLWGAITAASAAGPLPSSAGRRLTEFTELVATAVANTQSREHITALAEEQAALRRVATLVAEDVPPAELFRAVTGEVGALLGADFSGMAGLADGAVIPLAGWAAEGEHPPLPERWPMQPGDPVTAIAEAQRAVRWNDWAGIAGPIPAFIRDELGVRSTVGTPIVVEGRIWGVLAVHSRRPLPQDSEWRMEQFSNLVGTAIGNAEARGEVARLAKEQAALRRIATLVAAGAVPEQVFAAVTEETATTFHAITAVMRFEHDPPGNVVVGVSKETGIPIGTRWPLAEGMTSAEVYRTGRSARLGAVDWAAYPGPVAEAGLRFRVISQVACPIIVEGSVWGVVTLNAGEELPPDTEQRLEKFTELVTTAIANAEARVALRAAADEQGALRRVATLVAASAAATDVFAAVTEEIAVVLGADATLLCRADRDGAAVVVGTWGDNTPRVGTRIPRGGTNLTTIVLDTGHPARIESYVDATGDASEVARSHGLRSAVGAPILVEGRLWGLVIAGTTGDEPLPPYAEERLAGFTELVATAIANTDAREQMQALADQQASLRRVATLVAEGAPPDALFRAVADEVASVVGVPTVTLCHHHGDGSFTVVAATNNPGFPAGSRWPLDGPSLAATIHATGRAARIDDYSDLGGAVAAAVRDSSIRAAAGAPIVVDGKVWGHISVAAKDAEPLPAATEQGLRDFTELLATAISNATARADLVASRARIVAAGDEARRRIERNLHDGTQQRLIALGLDLQRVRAAIPDDESETQSALMGVEQDIETILVDLRELSHGLHPQLLSRLGLGPSLQALARRSPIPVHLDVDLLERPARSLETALYYVVSEALTNAIKHSHASEISVTITGGEKLRASIVDDGVGDAHPRDGSGLTGLLDRIDALGGRFALESPPRGGTRISIELPGEPTVAP
jgi:GAF domain-containing protein